MGLVTLQVSFGSVINRVLTPCLDNIPKHQRHEIYFLFNKILFKFQIIFGKIPGGGSFRFFK